MIDGLPEFAFAGGTFAGADEDDTVFGGMEEAETFGTADGLGELGAGGGGTGDDVEGGVAPVGGHLATTGTGIGGGTDGLEEHVEGRHAEGEGEGAVAVIRIEPVVTGLADEAGGDLDGFMAGSADLKVDFVLALEQDFAVVYGPGGLHEAKGAEQGFGIEPEGLGRFKPFGAGWRGERHRHIKMPS